MECLIMLTASDIGHQELLHPICASTGEPSLVSHRSSIPPLIRKCSIEYMCLFDVINLICLDKTCLVILRLYVRNDLHYMSRNTCK